MTIPEQQLETWASQGAVIQSRATYATVKGVLEQAQAPYAGRSVTLFLQGSYGNDTNIYADSDVDVVIRLNDLYYSDTSQLSEFGKANFERAFSAANYQYPDFKRDVTTWLTQKFGSAVKSGSKAIFIQGSGNRRDADILPAALLRRYRSFDRSESPEYIEGICFLLADGTRIDNFPQQHSDNCTTKHQATNQWFKPSVRILKNMRNRMIDHGLIVEGLAPSYYLEGLLYNVPNNNFGRSYESTLLNSINWILNADRSNFVCANEQFYLLRDGSPVTWREASCNAFLNALVQFWTGWS